MPTSSRRPRSRPRRPEERTSPLERQISWLLVAAVALLGLGAVAAGSSSGAGGGREAVEAMGAGELAAADGMAAAAGDPGDEGGGAAQEAGGRSFTVAATGDIIVHERVAQQAADGDGFDFSPMFARIAPIISSADLAICHLESPVSADNRDLAYYPAFRVPHQIVDAIAGAGYDGCSLASNHSLDGGEPTVRATVEKMASAGLTATGMATSPEDAGRPTIYEVAGVKVGHLSFTYGLNTGSLGPDQAHLVNILDPDAVLAAAAALREAGAEFVIASLHWGTEYRTEPDELQQQLVEPILGSPDVDLVVGHHAHVVQPIQRVGDEYAALGLGNLLSNQSPDSCSVCPPGTQDGVILRFTVSELPEGGFRVTGVEPIPTWVDRSTFTIVPLDGDPPEGYDASVLQVSRDRTMAALNQFGALG